MTKSKLTGKQRAFLEHYLTCWNATEAARRSGYSAKTANQQGPRLLVNVGIQNALAKRIGELKASADEVLLRLASHSRGTMDDFIGSLDRLDLERARERGVMHLIKKWKETTTTGEDFETHRVELELHDAQAATVQLARILGQFVERIEVRSIVQQSDPELIAEFTTLLDAARARAGDPDSGGTQAAGGTAGK